MKPLGVGVAAAVVLAGPPLYALTQSGSITGATALTRGLVLAGVCTFGASFLAGIIRDFQRDARVKKQGKVVHHPNSAGTPGTPGQQSHPGPKT